MSPIVVLFDVEGTLVRSGGAARAAWRWSFETNFGRAVDVEAHAEAGTLDPAIARRAFVGALGHEPTARDLAHLISGYLQRLPQEVDGSDRYQVLPGVEDTLGRLCDSGHLVGLVTGFLEGAAHSILARGGLNGYFCVGGYGADAPTRAEILRRALERSGAVLGGSVGPSDAVVVGDTPRVVAAAREAGVPVVGVATGPFTVADLEEAGADRTVDSLEGFSP